MVFHGSCVTNRREELVSAPKLKSEGCCQPIETNGSEVKENKVKILERYILTAINKTD